MDSLIEQVAQSKFVSTLDMAKGYYQVNIHPDSIPLTAFVTPRGFFPFQMNAFGLAGAPATFQILKNTLLAEHQPYCSVYLDDIAIFSDNWEEHLQHVHDVLQTLKDAGLTLRASKCQFARGTVQYLGDMIGSGQMRPMEAKVDSIVNWRVPQTKKQVQLFLGLAS